MSLVGGGDRGARLDAAATVAIVATIAIAVFVGTCRGPAAQRSEERCAAILDRYVELRERAVDPRPRSHLIAEHQEASRELAARAGELRRCAESISSASAECAEKAHSADELERCFP